jgi:hypothetical protein
MPPAGHVLGSLRDSSRSGLADCLPKCAADDALTRSCFVAGMRLPLEGTLLEKLRKIEALYAGTKVDGEREAARRAAERIRERLAELRGREEEIEYRYRLPDPWKRRLFLALCRRYGLKPYRERGQRQTSVMLRAPKSFQDRTLWPEYQALSLELDAHLDELTTRAIREAIDDDVSEAAEGTESKALPGSSVE